MNVLIIEITIGMVYKEGMLMAKDFVEVLTIFFFMYSLSWKHCRSCITPFSITIQIFRGATIHHTQQE